MNDHIIKRVIVNSRVRLRMCLKRKLIFFTEIVYLINEKYWFQRRFACWLFLHKFYDQVIHFEEEN